MGGVTETRFSGEPDWDVYFCLNLAEAAEEGRGPFQWTRNAYAWLHGRLDEARRRGLPSPTDDAEPVGPPSKLFPVLLSDYSKSGGAMAFIELGISGCAAAEGIEDFLHPPQQAADAAAAFFRRLGADVQHPHISFNPPYEVYGGSGSLSAFIITLVHLLGWKPAPDDICATGMWEDKKFRPVEPESLEGKTTVARKWGYRKLFVVEGQRGLDVVEGMEVIEVPSDPEFACLKIARHLVSNEETADEGFARVLAIFDQAAVRDEPHDSDLDRIMRMTEPFAVSKYSLAKHIAHDIRSRALLHAGRTDESEIERRCAEQVEPDLKPDGWLGDYLRWGQTAHRSVMAVDMGQWDENDRDHQRLRRVLDHLHKGAEEEGSGGKRELFAALQLANTDGMRLEFLGRLREDVDLLGKAWRRRTRLMQYWPHIMQYAQKLGLRDTSMHRQHNYCMDVLASYHALTGELPSGWEPDWGAMKFYPCKTDIEELADGRFPFDVFNWLRWQSITGNKLTEQEVEKALRSTKGKSYYPYTLIYEAVLRHAPVQMHGLRLRAARRLAEADFFDPSKLSRRSILTILSIRARRLLEEFKDVIEAPRPVEPEPETALARLAEELLREPDKIAARCPY